MNKPTPLIGLVLLLAAPLAWGAATRTIDADELRSSDATKTYSMPSSTQTLVGRTSTDTLTNKSISGASNTLTAVPVAGDVVLETPSGAINGSNTAFTLSFTPAAVDSVMVLLDGLVMLQTTDYSISGTTLTMTSAPVLGQTLRVRYPRY